MKTAPARPLSPFLLLFRYAGLESHRHLSPEQRTQLAQQWNDWDDGLAAQGKVEHGRPLGLQGRVVAGPHGERVIDEPFAEASPVLADVRGHAPKENSPHESGRAR